MQYHTSTEIMICMVGVQEIYIYIYIYHESNHKPFVFVSFLLHTIKRYTYLTFLDKNKSAAEGFLVKATSGETFWEHGVNHVFKKFNFFLLKFNMICMFWIILMC